MRKVFALLAWFLFIGTAEASPTGNNIITAQTPNRGVLQFLQGTDPAGTYKTLYTAGVNGSKCFGLWETNSDPTSTHLVSVQVVNSGIKYGGVSIATAVNQGFATGVPPGNFTGSTNWPGLPVDSDGNPYLLLAFGDTLQATFATALTTATLINLVITCSDF